jgi:hypothetical protein
VAAVLVAVALGLIAPPGLRRFARGTVVVVFSIAALIYLLPGAPSGWRSTSSAFGVVASDDDLPHSARGCGSPSTEPPLS